MFYSHTLLAKKGPLAKVWIAAHLEKKLTRAQIQQTDIKKIAEEIRKPAQPLALRLSGQLLLGITRIYYRKVALLYEDGQLALKKLKEFFEPAQNITLADTGAAGALTLADASGVLDKSGLDDGLERFGGNEQEFDPFDDENNQPQYLMGASTGKGRSKATIPMGDSTNTLALETTMEDQFGGGAGRRGRVSDIEAIRRADATPEIGGLRKSLNAPFTGSTDDEERRSAITGSDAGDSTRRSRRARPEDLEAAAERRNKRSSLLDKDEDDYGMGDALGLGDLAGPGMDAPMDMGLGDADYGAPDYDYGEMGTSSGAVAGAGSSDSKSALLSDADITAALKKKRTAGDEGKDKERQEVAQRKRDEAKAKARERQTDARIVIPGDTIKEWLKDTSPITKPRLTGNARMAHVYKSVEDARNKRRQAAAEGRKVYISEGVESSMELIARLDMMQLSPAVWSMVALGKTTFDPDPRIDAAAQLMIAALGTTSMSHAAAKRRNILGLRDLSGVGDLTEDGDILSPCPAVLDPAVHLTQFSRVGPTLVGPALAKLWYAHTHSKASYPPSSQPSHDAEAEEEGMAGERIVPDLPEELNYDADGPDYGAPDVDYGQQGNAEDWHEGPGDTPDAGRSKVSSAVVGSGERASLLGKMKAEGGLGAEPASMLVDDEFMSDSPPGGVETADDDVGAAPSGTVDPHKMHVATVRALKALAAAMTGPAAGETEAGKAGKKRKSREDGGLAAYPFGNLKDTTHGIGSASDPLSFNDFNASVSRREAATSFYQLLILKSMDMVQVEQAQPCGDILIRRTPHFAMALEARDD